MIDLKSDFIKIITSNKDNIKEIWLENSDNLNSNHIIHNIDILNIISYLYRRLLRVRDCHSNIDRTWNCIGMDIAIFHLLFSQFQAFCNPLVGIKVNVYENTGVVMDSYGCHW